MPSVASSTIRPALRWTRFSIRGLLLLTLLAALGCSWLRWQVVQGREQDRLEAELNAFGVDVWQYRPNGLGRVLWRIAPAADAWAARFLGRGALHQVAGVTVNRALSDREFREVVARLKRCRELSSIEVEPEAESLEERLSAELPGVDVYPSFLCGGTL